MQKIQNVTKEYINDEEVSQVVAANKRLPANPHPRKPVYSEKQRETLGDLVKASAVEGQDRGNKNLYSDYHKGFRHKTQDCFDFKDALEQAIREGKLAEFSQFIREPRRREREQSEEDCSRAVKQRQGSVENTDSTPTIVVNVVVGRDSPPKSKSETRKDVKILAALSGNPRILSRDPPRMSFGSEDQWLHDLPENPPMVTTVRIDTGLVKRILVDTGANSNIMFRNVFDALRLKEADLKVYQHEIIGLGDNYIRPDGVITLPVCVGSNEAKKSVIAEFVVLQDSTAYNVIMERKTINEFSAVICTKFLIMKFVTDDVVVGSIRCDLETTVACDNTSVSLRKRLKEAAGVFLADLDARLDENSRPEP
ncbi:uncharacterized protein LOC130974704 [Arachis stenosperma]|uniref:uncharacterized protein LOC130974704 n=1 Tax=Arachis stenosperma TaxID=217475 RepID=UPI0025AD14F9|nr:uncharacterized protein LOC130974704 [Arachis stenosperma]